MRILRQAQDERLLSLLKNLRSGRGEPFHPFVVSSDRGRESRWNRTRRTTLSHRRTLGLPLPHAHADYGQFLPGVVVTQHVPNGR